MKVEQHKKARELRQSGQSIRKISKDLQVSKSSVSRWVRGIELSPEQLRILHDNSYKFQPSTRNGQIALREKRHAEYRAIGYKKAQEDQTFRIICALYWGEGSKDRNRFTLANTDTMMLRGFVDWLRQEGYNEKMTFCVHYYPNNGISEETIADFWVEKLSLLRTQLRKFSVCIINRASQQKHIGKRPYGTGHLTVCDTRLIQMVHGGIEFLRTNKW